MWANFSVMGNVEIWLQFIMALTCVESCPFLTWIPLLALGDHQCPCCIPHSRWQLDASPCGSTLLAEDKKSSAQKKLLVPLYLKNNIYNMYYTYISVSFLGQWGKEKIIRILNLTTSYLIKFLREREWKRNSMEDIYGKIRQ